MAWKWRLTEVSYEQQTVDDQGNPVTLDLSRNGRFRVVYEVLNDANAVVDTRTLGFAHDVDRATARQRIAEDVSRIRDARVRVAALQGDIGTTVPVA